MNAYLRAMRLERWPRSLAIFLGSAAFFFLERETAGRFSLPATALRLAGAYLLTWAISTANYILNEIVDLPFDVHHPTKRFRPLVQGEIKRVPFSLLGLAIIAASLTASYAIYDIAFFLSALALFLAGIVYNVKPIRTKDIPFLDAISESANNPVRFLIGWYAFAPLHVFPPVALLVSWWSFGNFLMVAKRLSEFRFLKDKAGDYRSSHKKYTRNSLLFGLAASGLICLASFLFLAHELALWTFYLISPFILLLLGLILRKTLREEAAMEEPEKLLASPRFALYTIFLVLLFLLAYFKEAIKR
jgi:decaprenyl-phosphate phosphoribosyltransferase